MKFVPAALALAAVLAAPAMAQTAATGTRTTTTTVTSSSGVPVTTPHGIAVTPGVAIVNQSQLPNAVLTPAGTHTQVAPGSTTKVTTYWVDVPSYALADPNFKRWQALK